MNVTHGHSDVERHNEPLRCQNWDRLLSFCAILAEAHSIIRERCMCIFIEIVASTSTTTADTIDYVVTDSRSFTLSVFRQSPLRSYIFIYTLHTGTAPVCFSSKKKEDRRDRRVNDCDLRYNLFFPISIPQKTALLSHILPDRFIQRLKLNC